MNLCVCEQQWVLNIYGADTFCSLIRDYHQVSSAEPSLEGGGWGAPSPNLEAEKREEEEK